MDGSLYGPGWTGYPSVSTTGFGTVATPPPQAAAPDQPQPIAGIGCVLCQHPTVRAAVFIGGFALLLLAWRTHLAGMME